MRIPFDLKKLENISFSNRRVFLRQFGKIRRGSSRLVLEIDDNWVIKVAYNVKGIAQNKVEYDTYKFASAYNRTFLAKVNLRIKKSACNHFIIQEKVKPLKDSVRYKFGCPRWAEYNKKCKEFSNKRSFKTMCLNFDLYVDEIAEQLGKNKKGRLVSYDYGFSKYVCQNFY